MVAIPYQTGHQFRQPVLFKKQAAGAESQSLIKQGINSDNDQEFYKIKITKVAIPYQTGHQFRQHQKLYLKTMK
jgi:hypothetical protein